MVHLTRCLECERGRDRKESFLDISIAVKHLKDADDDSPGEEDEGELNSNPTKLGQNFILRLFQPALRFITGLWTD